MIMLQFCLSEEIIEPGGLLFATHFQLRSSATLNTHCLTVTKIANILICLYNYTFVMFNVRDENERRSRA